MKKEMLTGSADMGNGVTARAEYSLTGGDNFQWHIVATDAKARDTLTSRPE